MSTCIRFLRERHEGVWFLAIIASLPLTYLPSRWPWWPALTIAWFVYWGVALRWACAIVADGWRKARSQSVWTSVRKTVFWSIYYGGIVWLTVWGNQPWPIDVALLFGWAFLAVFARVAVGFAGAVLRGETS